MEELLASRGRVPWIGAEKELRSRHPSVRCYRSQFGSTRYVYFKDGEPISALQVVSKDGRQAVIANVYTREKHQRRGIASLLLSIARRDFRKVEHSEHLSESGKAWSVTEAQVRRSRQITLKNWSSYDTSDLLQFFERGLRGLKARGHKNIMVVPSPIRSRGCATVGGHQIVIAIASPSHFSLRRLARLFEHEVTHNKGLDHEEMDEDVLWSLGPIPSWAQGTVLRWRRGSKIRRVS